MFCLSMFSLAPPGLAVTAMTKAKYPTPSLTVTAVIKVRCPTMTKTAVTNAEHGQQKPDCDCSDKG